VSADVRAPPAKKQSVAVVGEMMPPIRSPAWTTVRCYHGGMPKNLTVRLDDQLAADTEALARAEGKSLNETIKLALSEAVERRRSDPQFKARVRKIIEQDRELLERLAK
jgi:hypothetical protein